VTVDNLPAVPISDEDSNNTITCTASRDTSNYGVSSGTINRLTGAAEIQIVHDGLLIFGGGTCKRSNNLIYPRG
jgi:hypothetical protein